MSIKAMKMALEVMEYNRIQGTPNMGAAIEALRQAIEHEEGRLSEITRQFVGVNKDGSERWVETEYRTVTKREWVGLTDEEIQEIIFSIRAKTMGVITTEDLSRLIEAKLKEKNT